MLKLRALLVVALAVLTLHTAAGNKGSLNLKQTGKRLKGGKSGGKSKGAVKSVPFGKGKEGIPCSPNYCENGGTCWESDNAENGYECKCPADYEGPSCQQFIFSRSGSGRCGFPPTLQFGYLGWVAGDGSAARYECKRGFRMEGNEMIYCENKVWQNIKGKCREMERCPGTNPCKNGGTCWVIDPTTGENECECPRAHFKGPHCEKSRMSTKKGLAVSLSRLKDCKDFRAFKNVGWWYDWGLSEKETKGKIRKTQGHDCDAGDLSNLGERTGMIYDGDKVVSFGKLVDDLKSTGEVSSEYVMCFNEPNHNNQANMTPIAAARAMFDIVKAAKLAGKKLVTPSASICGESETRCTGQEVDEWFRSFFDLCFFCSFDYLATHYFGCNVDNLMQYLDFLHKTFKMDIWLTEVSCPRVDDQTFQLKFMKDALQRLEKTPYVKKYAYYTWRLRSTDTYIRKGASLLHEGAPQLTALGRLFDRSEVAVD